MADTSLVPQVLYEDNHLLVLNKPAGMVTQGAARRELSLYHWGCAYVKRKYGKPGNVFLGVVSRLDQPVSGVVLFARTSKAAARLSAAFRERRVEKLYWALLCPSPESEQGTWQDELIRDDDLKVTRVKNRRVGRIAPQTPQQPSEGGQIAELSYQVLERFGRVALVEIRLVTGRKHQIRAQASARGCPVVGDRQYGSRLSFPEGIALHARRLVFPHPTLRQDVTVEAPLPAAWRQYLPKGARLG
ncbi:MAG: pseudouridine synthase [Pirellulaceae bacterium]|nr:MAG: pseudouridine synthase [Pirellulaceae bacterium]